jgi:hypothetical protein
LPFSSIYWFKRPGISGTPNPIAIGFLSARGGLKRTNWGGEGKGKNWIRKAIAPIERNFEKGPLNRPP